MVGQKHKVCSLEQAKKLKELRPDLDTSFVYCTYIYEGEDKTDLIASQLKERWETMTEHDDVEDMDFYPAPDIVELMVLIDSREINLSKDKDEKFNASYPKRDISVSNDIPARALASITLEILSCDLSE